MNRTWLKSPLFKSDLSRLELQRIILEMEDYADDEDPAFVRDPYTSKRTPRIKAIKILSALRELEKRRSDV